MYLFIQVIWAHKLRLCNRNEKCALVNKSFREFLRREHFMCFFHLHSWTDFCLKQILHLSQTRIFHIRTWQNLCKTCPGDTCHKFQSSNYMSLKKIMLAEICHLFSNRYLIFIHTLFNQWNPPTLANASRK